MEKKYKFLNEIKTIEHLENMFNTDEWRILQEKQSTFPNAKVILDCIFRYIEDHKEESLIKKLDVGRYYQFDIPFSIFPLAETFFYGIDLTINCFEKNMGIADDDPRINFNQTSQYITKNATLYKNKLCEPVIIINYVANYGCIYYDVIAPIMHEFLHAYEDYMRLMKGQKPLSIIANSQSYETLADGLKKTNSNVVQHVAQMFYYCLKNEQNAFVSQMHNEIKELAKDENFPNTTTEGILKQLSMYKNFIQFEDDIYYLKNEADNTEKQEVLEFIQKAINKNIQNYKHALGIISNVVLRAEKNAIIKLKRIIRYYQKGNGMLFERQSTCGIPREEMRRRGYRESVLDVSRWFEHMVNYGKKEKFEK